MNAIAEEMRAILEDDEEALAHIGMPRRSGRYPWGSGEDPYQHGSNDFLGRIEELKKSGWTETPENIKEMFGMTTTQYRIEKGLAKDERRMLNVARAKSLQKDGLGATEIGRELGVRESTVRSWLNAESEARMNQAIETANFLKKQIDEKGMIDVGVGVERELNISKEKMKEALAILERDGYPVYKGGIPQATNPGKQINQQVACPPGTEHKEIYDFSRVHSVREYITRDDGVTYEKKFHYPESMDSKRLKIRYAEEGGIDKDGIVELRRGVQDLSLGESRYSQVRILVDGTHYIKGMALYADDKDMPKGVDVIFNTNKKLGTDKMDVLKKIKTDDPDNPFGSAIKDAEKGGQYWYTDKKTGERKLGLINKRADEGDWDDWSNALPSQFLGKQSLAMAKKQLNLAKADKLAEYDDICSLTNPTIKKHLLEEFANNCDSAAVNLKAAALPGQKYHVIVPITSLKDNEVYATNYPEGSKLALIRYPHGGTFEIPILTVTHKNATANKLIGKQSVDVVGINAKVAERLSGADFDGDTVMCIPTHDSRGKVKITSTDPLKGLEGFDPKTQYKEREGMRYMTKKSTQTQMGIISNLITDMTLAGAGSDELARAVRHSMVVIDAEKHKLDYKQSEIDNNITALKKKYQPKFDDDGNLVGYGGASTILSRSKGEVSVNKRQGSPQINVKGKKWYDPTKPEGALLYKDADDLYYPSRKYDKDTGIVTLRTSDGKKISYNVNDKDAVSKYNPVKRVDPDTGEVSYTSKDGKITYRLKAKTQPSTRMAEADDAYTLVSEARHPMEMAYADYANSMKSLANKARMEMMRTGKIEYSASAKKAYQAEVSSLMSKLNTALLNAPRERAAQRMANAEVDEKIAKNPELKKKGDDLKKARNKALTNARKSVNSSKRSDRNIEITDREWEAIQAGAISENHLKKILANTDADKLRQRATPRATTTLSPAKINRIKAMGASNHSLNDIAKALGVSTSTVANYLKGVK